MTDAFLIGELLFDSVNIYLVGTKLICRLSVVRKNTHTLSMTGSSYPFFRKVHFNIEFIILACSVETEGLVTCFKRLEITVNES